MNKPHRLTKALVVTLALLACLSPMALHASSHSEAPGTEKDKGADGTDLYAFVSMDAPNCVTLVSNFTPLIEPNSGPNFYSFDDDVTYWFKIDNVGDAQDHIRYKFTFRTSRQTDATFLYNTGVVTSLTDPDLNVRQYYTVTRYDGDSPTELGTNLQVAPAYVGPVSMPDYAALAKAAVMTLSDGTKVFAGVRDDPFFVDLGATFDLLTIRKPPGNRGGGVDGVGGFDVLSIVLQIPKRRLTNNGRSPDSTNSVIGIRQTADRASSRTLNGDGTMSTSGSPVQVSRLGMPVVNEVVIPLKDKDRFNASMPDNDTQFLGYITDPELAKLLKLLYNISSPPAPRNDLVTVFLTGIPGLNKPANANQVPCEMLRLNMSIPPASAQKTSRFGILGGDNAGFPNGRRLTDDVIDISERVVAGATPFTPQFNIAPNNLLGDGVDANDKPFLPYFPYVALPNNPLDHQHHQQALVGSDGARDGDHGGGNGGGNGGGWGHGHKAQAGDAETDAAAQAKPVEFGMNLKGANPASASRLEYSLPSAAHVNLSIFDVQGRNVRTLIDQDAAAGSFTARWDGTTETGLQANKGVYFARLNAGGKTTEKKVVLQ